MRVKQIAILIITIITIITGNIVYGANKTNKTNTTEVEKKDEGLASIEIEGAKISPDFETKKYDYDVKYIGEAEKLQITATPTEAYYTVKIIGNDNIQEGEEKIITILVSDSENNNVAVYQLNVQKSLVDEEEVAQKEREANEERKKNISIIIGGVALTIIILILLIISIVKSRKEE